MVDVEVIGYGGTSGTSVGTNTSLVMENSSMTNGRMLGTGSVELRFVSVDENIAIATETCFAVARLDNSTFSDTGCP